MSNENIVPAIDRLFRAYSGYLQDSSKDTLFLLLNSIHSLDERVKGKYGRLFFGIPEYLTLKALRNLEQHGAEVKYVLADKTEAYTVPGDLVFACLISTVDCEAAISETAQRFRDQTREAFTASALRYGDVVDINPCIFNCVVRMYEILTERGLLGTSAEFEELAESYRFEEEYGHSHFVSGRIEVLAGDASGVAEWLHKRYLEMA